MTKIIWFYNESFVSVPLCSLQQTYSFRTSHSCNRCQETQHISKAVHGGVSDTFFFFWAGFTISNVLLHIRTTENSKFHLASFFCHCGLRKIAIVLRTLSFLKSSDIIYEGNRTTSFFLWNRKKNIGGHIFLNHKGFL